jgi:hypothetical protein
MVGDCCRRGAGAEEKLRPAVCDVEPPMVLCFGAVCYENGLCSYGAGHSPRFRADVPCSSRFWGGRIDASPTQLALYGRAQASGILRCDWATENALLPVQATIRVSPGAVITREQMATFMHVCGGEGITMPSATIPSAVFHDSAAVADWLRSA